MKQNIKAIVASLFATLFFFFTALFLLARTSYACPDTGDFFYKPLLTINVISNDCYNQLIRGVYV